MLGYFRDPDVGFVIGPQVYGNYDTSVTKAAESQQFLFHALIQRAGNRYGAPMFVGTSNAVRIKRAQADRRAVRLDHRGHGHRLRDAPRTATPRPGKKWRSVYTPDVLAVGEGPDRLDGLLHPAAALVARDVRDDPQAVLEGLVLAAARASSSTTR